MNGEEWSRRSKLISVAGLKGCFQLMLKALEELCHLTPRDDLLLVN